MLFISIAVAYADYLWANVYRNFASGKNAHLKNYKTKIWFAGHWGFQYYVEQEGFEHVSMENLPQKGDIIICATLANYSFPQDWLKTKAMLIEEYTYITSFPIRTMQRGAGFYSSGSGFFPFVISDVPLEIFEVWKVN